MLDTLASSVLSVLGCIPGVDLEFVLDWKSVQRLEIIESGMLVWNCECEKGEARVDMAVYLWNPPCRTNSLRRKGVVFSLSIRCFVTELRLSGDAIFGLCLRFVW